MNFGGFVGIEKAVSAPGGFINMVPRISLVAI